MTQYIAEGWAFYFKPGAEGWALYFKPGLYYYILGVK